MTCFFFINSNKRDSRGKHLSSVLTANFVLSTTTPPRESRLLLEGENHAVYSYFKYDLYKSSDFRVCRSCSNKNNRSLKLTRLSLVLRA